MIQAMRFNYQRFFYLGDAFRVLLIFILALPFGSGCFGFRCALEHPVDGSSFGPANPWRNFFYYFLAMPFRPGLLWAHYRSVAFCELYSDITIANILCLIMIWAIS